jgi:hypothetical protein
MDHFERALTVMGGPDQGVPRYANTGHSGDIAREPLKIERQGSEELNRIRIMA